MARGEPLIRQWNLLKALQAHRFGIGVDELANRLECSKRQVRRDLNVLQQVGFPVSFEERDFSKRFWKLSPMFIERQELVLSVTEMLSLFLSRQVLSPLTGTQFGDGLAWTTASLRHGRPDRPSPPYAPRPARPPQVRLAHVSWYSYDVTVFQENMSGGSTFCRAATKLGGS
jgi:predicted DNA-binding transcriptional regulator YafY